MTRGNKPAEKRYAIGADIGGSHLSSAIIDLDTGNIAGDITNTSLDNSASAPEILYTVKVPVPFRACNTIKQPFPVGKETKADSTWSALLRKNGPGSQTVVQSKKALCYLLQKLFAHKSTNSACPPVSPPFPASFPT